MSSLGTVLEIFKASGRVLRRHPRLLVFPLLTVGAMLFLLLLFLPYLDEEPVELGFSMALFYFCGQLVQNFLDAALTCESLRALRGQEVSVSGGLGSAATRLGAIAGYSGITSTVGLFVGWIGPWGRNRRLLPRLLGTGWMLITYLALPVMMAERRGGYDSIRRSTLLFRQTWGEAAIAEVGLRLAWVQFMVLIGVLAALLVDLVGEPFVVALVLCAVLAFVILMGALQAIYRAALYMFAAEGVIPGEFDTPQMNEVWRVK